MTFDEYQQLALKTDLFSGGMQSILDPAFMAKLLGLVGEAGEVADKFKKIIRDGNSQLTDENKADIVKELGDVLWYIATMSHYLGFTFDDLAKVNLEKLASRQARGQQRGSGDNR